MIGKEIRQESLLLFLGDWYVFALTLWLALVLRHWAWPDRSLYLSHLEPFSIIFVCWTAVFFIADLYNCRPNIDWPKSRGVLLNAQIINSVLALAFFYYTPSFGITPKTILFIYLVLVFIAIFYWRFSINHWLYRGRSVRYLFLSHGRETEEVKAAFKKHNRYQVEVVEGESMAPNGPDNRAVDVVVVDPFKGTLPEFNSSFRLLIFSGSSFVNTHDLYEDIFGKVPISVINESWFLTQVELAENGLYRILKRTIDITISLLLFILSLPLYPFIWLAIKLEDGGSLFYTEERVGRFGRVFMVRKFRSMSQDANLSERKVTKVGYWLRKLRLDELPQLLSVLAGKQSLIGPRPERPEYVQVYEKEIPYYHARHFLPPGLSGWAQIYHENHPHFGVATEATREKLAYDLYYIKHRSFWLDAKIALKTIRTLLSRSGR